MAKSQDRSATTSDGQQNHAAASTCGRAAYTCIRRSIPDLASRLEHEFQSQLTLPGPDGRIADHAEVGIANIGVWRTEHGVVEGILRLQAQFQLHLFVFGDHCEFLQDGQVGAEEEGTAHGSHRPRRIAQGVRGRRLEYVRIRKIVVNPVGFRATTEFRSANQIGPLSAVCPMEEPPFTAVN